MKIECAQLRGHWTPLIYMGPVPPGTGPMKASIVYLILTLQLYLELN